jgi:hypothetical protein
MCQVKNNPTKSVSAEAATSQVGLADSWFWAKECAQVLLDTDGLFFSLNISFYRFLSVNPF